MGTSWIHNEDNLGAFAGAQAENSDMASSLLVASNIAAAAAGCGIACFNLGVAYSTGSHGVNCDLVEAHMWFNLAAVGGHEEAACCRADIAEDMTAREIAEAQRRAREWIAATCRRAACFFSLLQPIPPSAPVRDQASAEVSPCDRGCVVPNGFDFRPPLPFRGSGIRPRHWQSLHVQ